MPMTVWYRDTLLLCSLLFLLIISLAALILPLFPQFDPNSFDPSMVSDPQPPSWQHPLGTDDLNRDLLLRCIYGARLSLMVGLISVSISVTVGVLIGLIAGSQSLVCIMLGSQ